MKTEKKTHTMWKEKVGKSLVGRWHYIYSSKKGKISLIKLIDYYGDGKDLWEIYCIENNLFSDIERFSCKKKAETRVKELL